MQKFQFNFFQLIPTVFQIPWSIPLLLLSFSRLEPWNLQNKKFSFLTLLNMWAKIWLSQSDSATNSYCIDDQKSDKLVILLKKFMLNNIAFYSMKKIRFQTSHNFSLMIHANIYVHRLLTKIKHTVPFMISITVIATFLKFYYW
jgi:hypothetical protein